MECSYKQNNKSFIINDLNNIAGTHLLQGHSDSAAHYYQRSISYLSETDVDQQAFAYYNIGAFYYETGNPSEAKLYIQQSIAKRSSEDQKFSSYAILANICYAAGKVDSADYYWDKSLMSQDPAVKECTYNYLYNRFFFEENYVAAIKYAELYMQYADSVYRLTTAKEVAEIQVKYDNETLQRKHLESKLSLFYLWFSLWGVFCLAVSLFVCFGIRVSRQKRKLNDIILYKKEELDLLKREFMNLQVDNSSNIGENYMLKGKLELLRNKIVQKESEIETIRSGYKQSKVIEREEKYDKAIVEGLRLFKQIDEALDTSKPLFLNTTSFQSFVCFYQEFDMKFMISLKKKMYVLTPMECTICILFRREFSHKKVANLIGNTPETLSRSKNRIKEKMLHKDLRTLEEIMLLL